MFDRRSTRLAGWDYASDGCYFVTICIHERHLALGDVVGGGVRLNQFGQVVADAWRWLALQYVHVVLDEWCVMPDHLHAILKLDSRRGASQDRCRGASRGAPTGTPGPLACTPSRPKPLGQLIGAFKTVSTRRVNELRGTPRMRLWQRGYYDRVIRDAMELERTREYIRLNPTTEHPDLQRG